MSGELSAQQPAFNLETQGNVLVLAEQAPEAFGLTDEAAVLPQQTDAEALRTQSGIEDLGTWDAITSDIKHSMGHNVALRAKQTLQQGGDIHSMVVQDAQRLAEQGLDNTQVSGFMQYAKAAADYLDGQRPDRQTHMAFQHDNTAFIANKESFRGYTEYTLTSLTSGRVIAFNGRGPDQAAHGIYEDVEPLELAEFAGLIDRGDPVVALSRDTSAAVALSAADALRADSLSVYDRHILASADNYIVAVRSLRDASSLAAHTARYGDGQGILAHTREQIAEPETLHIADWTDRKQIESIPTMPDKLRPMAHNSIGIITADIKGYSQEATANRQLIDKLVTTALQESDTPAGQDAALLVGKLDQQDESIRACLRQQVYERYKALANDEQAQAAFVAHAQQVAPAFTAALLAEYAVNGIEPSTPTLQALLAEQDTLNSRLKLRNTVAFLKQISSKPRGRNFENGVAPEQAAIEEAIEALAVVAEDPKLAVTAASRQALAAAGIQDPELIDIALERVRGDTEDDGQNPDIILGSLVRALLQNGTALKEKRLRAAARERSEALAPVQALIDPEAYALLGSMVDSASQYVVRPAEAAVKTIEAIRADHEAAVRQSGGELPPVRTMDDITRLFVSQYSPSLTELARSDIVTSAVVEGNTIRLHLDADVMATHQYQDHPGDGLPWPGKKFSVGDRRYVYNHKGVFQSSYEGFEIQNPDGPNPIVIVTVS